MIDNTKADIELLNAIKRLAASAERIADALEKLVNTTLNPLPVEVVEE